MKCVRRGFEPKDAYEFGVKSYHKLNRAAVDLFFLLNRGYDIKSASTFIGNHYLLSERQRMALARMISPEEMLHKREERKISLEHPPSYVEIDGFNLIVTLEVALSQALLLEGMDGTYRDLAGLRGTYRIVDKTIQAVSLLLTCLDRLCITSAVLYLDQPVSNSGRLRSLLLEMARDYAVALEVQLQPDVDRCLAGLEGVVTTDAIILNGCKSWLNLGRYIIDTEISDAWVFRLNHSGSA